MVFVSSRVRNGECFRLVVQPAAGCFLSHCCRPGPLAGAPYPSRLTQAHSATFFRLQFYLLRGSQGATSTRGTASCPRPAAVATGAGFGPNITASQAAAAPLLLFKLPRCSYKGRHF